jgi:SAM-dependent MidA family methyltransferase
VFANEFFDALPVDVVVAWGGKFHERRVGFRGGRFHWETAGPVSGEVEEYLRRYAAPAASEEDEEDGEGFLVEANIQALGWIERIAASLEEGYLFAVDYGYTRPEVARFPRGTLMSYRGHTAREDVLENPGEQDITAHVNFTALGEHGRRHGLAWESFQSLTRTLLDAGQPDQFAAALADADRAGALRRRMQLKTLLAGLGETFRVLLARQTGEGGKSGQNILATK